MEHGAKSGVWGHCARCRRRCCCSPEVNFRNPPRHMHHMRSPVILAEEGGDTQLWPWHYRQCQSPHMWFQAPTKSAGGAIFQGWLPLLRTWTCLQTDTATFICSVNRELFAFRVFTHRLVWWSRWTVVTEASNRDLEWCFLHNISFQMFQMCVLCITVRVWIG